MVNYFYAINTGKGNNKIYKIGITGNIYQRYKDYATHCGDPKLLFLIQNDQEDYFNDFEKYLKNEMPIYQDYHQNQNIISKIIFNDINFPTGKEFFYIPNFELLIQKLNKFGFIYKVLNIDDFKIKTDIQTNEKRKFNLYKHQIEFINIFKNLYDKDNNVSGILSMATGAGKTYALIECIEYIWNFIHKPILWISIQKNILKSNNFSKYNIKIINLTDGEVNKVDFDLFKDEKVIFCCLRQTLTSNSTIDSLKNYFVGIVYDEVHDGFCSKKNSGKTFEKMKLLKENNNLSFCIGASATPLINELSQYNKICEIFKSDKNDCILYSYNYKQAVDDKILVPLNFHFINDINSQDFERQFNDKIYQLPIPKILFYMKTIEEVDKYYKLYKEKYLKYKICKSTANYSIDDDMFIEEYSETPIIMFACKKFTVGTDIEDLSLIIDCVNNNKSYKIIQKKGRLTRKDKYNHKMRINPEYWKVITTDNVKEESFKIINNLISYILGMDKMIDNTKLNTLIKEKKIKYDEKKILFTELNIEIDFDDFRFSYQDFSKMITDEIEKNEYNKLYEKFNQDNIEDIIKLTVAMSYNEQDNFNISVNKYQNQLTYLFEREFIESLILYINKNLLIQNILNKNFNEYKNKMSTIENKKELLEYIEKNLKPKKEEKELYSEVYTPIWFIEQMINDIEKHDPELFNNPNIKIYDPCCGMGNFQIVLYYKLMETLKFWQPNNELREKHILENILYMGEINEKNCIIFKNIFDKDNKYKLNLYCGDTVNLDIKTIFNVEYFDLIITNPPFTESNTNIPKYDKFIKYYIDKCKYFSIITPSSWLARCSKVKEEFVDNFFKRNDIVYIKDCKDIFKEINLSGFIYFLKKSNYSEKCQFNEFSINLNDYDRLYDNMFKNINLINKLKKYKTLDSIYNSRDLFGIETNANNLTNISDYNKIKCYVNQKMGREAYINKNNVKNLNIKKWRVITAYANGNYECFGYTCICKPDEIYAGTYISFEVNSELEANSLLSYLNTKFTNYILSISVIKLKINKKICKNIPLVPLDRIWNDIEIYKYFKLTDEEIKTITNINLKGFKKNINEENNDFKTNILSNNENNYFKNDIVLNEKINKDDIPKTIEDVIKNKDKLINSRYTVEQLKKICEYIECKKGKKKADYINNIKIRCNIIN